MEMFKPIKAALNAVMVLIDELTVKNRYFARTPRDDGLHPLRQCVGAACGYYKVYQLSHTTRASTPQQDGSLLTT
jgi:hypothetical protein